MGKPKFFHGRPKAVAKKTGAGGHRAMSSSWLLDCPHAVAGSSCHSKGIVSAWGVWDGRQCPRGREVRLTTRHESGSTGLVVKSHSTASLPHQEIIPWDT